MSTDITCHDSLCVCGRPKLAASGNSQSKVPKLDDSLIAPWKAMAHAKIKLQYLTMLKDKDALDLEPTQLLLRETENLYKHHGIWSANRHALQENAVPAGQAILNELFDECYDLISSLQDSSSEPQNPVIAFQRKHAPETIVKV